jgi:hypothetical protein
MPSEEMVNVSPMEVTPKLGKGTQDIWWFHHRHRARTQSRDQPMQGMERGSGQTAKVGAYANQRLNLADDGKAHGGYANVSNRTWEIRPSGIIGGPRETWPWWK